VGWCSLSIVEAKNLADLYKLPPIEWALITTRLGEGLTQAPETGGPNRHTCWLATINDDGSPHVTGVGAVWVDGTFWFETGARTRKGRNLDLFLTQLTLASFATGIVLPTRS